LIAGAGAMGARVLAASSTGNLRLAAWIGGSAVIFLGLWVVSLGSRRPDDRSGQ
jgi:hypothetical protein